MAYYYALTHSLPLYCTTHCESPDYPGTSSIAQLVDTIQEHLLVHQDDAIDAQMNFY